MRRDTFSTVTLNPIKYMGRENLKIREMIIQIQSVEAVTWK